jgi:hypothetical protein
VASLHPKRPKGDLANYLKPRNYGPLTHSSNILSNPLKIPPVNYSKMIQALGLVYPQVVTDNTYAGPAAQNLGMMRKIAEGGRKFPGTRRKICA